MTSPPAEHPGVAAAAAIRRQVAAALEHPESGDGVTAVTALGGHADRLEEGHRLLAAALATLDEA